MPQQPQGFSMDPLTRLSETASGLKIWWDSSPLIFGQWGYDLLCSIEDPEERSLLAGWLSDLYDPEGPETSTIAGCTTNPVLAWQVIEAQPTLWNPRIKEMAESAADPEELFWTVYHQIVEWGARMLMPIYEATNGRDGHISAQVDPRELTNTETMLKQAQRLHVIAPNVMIKMPGTEAGIKGVENLALNGISTNGTLIFTISQIINYCKAVENGLDKMQELGQVGAAPGYRPVVTMMLGRMLGKGVRDDISEFELSAQEAGVDLTEEMLRWAELAIFYKAYRIIQERGYRTRLLAASMRVSPEIDGVQHIWHLANLAGMNDVVLTVFPDVIKAFLKYYAEREIVPCWEEGVPEEALKTLMRIPYFREAYEEDGLKPEEFDTHPPVIATADEFASATDDMHHHCDNIWESVHGV